MRRIGIQKKLLEKNLELSEQKSFRQDKLTEALQNLDYNSLSPKQAFDILWGLKEYTN